MEAIEPHAAGGSHPQARIPVAGHAPQTQASGPSTRSYIELQDATGATWGDELDLTNGDVANRAYLSLVNHEFHGDPIQRARIIAALSTHYSIVSTDAGRISELKRLWRDGAETFPQDETITSLLDCTIEWIRGNYSNAVQLAIPFASAGCLTYARKEHAVLLANGQIAGILGDDRSSVKLLQAGFLSIEHGALQNQSGMGLWISAHRALLDQDLHDAAESARQLLGEGNSSRSAMSIALAMHCFGSIAVKRGDHVSARLHFTDSLQSAIVAKSTFLQSLSHLGIATALELSGDAAGSADSLKSAHSIAQSAGLALPSMWDGVKATDSHATGSSPQLFSLPVGGLHKPVPSTPAEYQVNLMGRFSLTSLRGVAHSMSRNGGRPQTLLKLLVSLDARKGIPVDRVSTLMWPEAEGDMARSSLDTTLFRLRRQAQLGDIIELRRGTIFIDGARLSADLWQLESLLFSLETYSEPNSASQWLSRQICQLYRGDLLEMDEHSWLAPVRERVKRRVTLAIEKILSWTIARHDSRIPHELCEKLIQIDPLSERSYRLYMQALIAENCHADALRIYQRCRLMLSEAIGQSTSPTMEALRAKIQYGIAGR